MNNGYSEIRESTKLELLEKSRKRDYGKYLHKIDINRIRGFSNENVEFDFPVTALIGPNGSGKSSILGAAACAYKKIKPSTFFPKSSVGDESMSGWRVEYEATDKTISAKQIVKRTSNFRQAKWVRGDVLDREVLYFGIERTVPAGEKTIYKKLAKSSYKHKNPLSNISTDTCKQIEHIIGKSVSDFKYTDIGHGVNFFIGQNGGAKYSEFHFGAGESSIIRMVSAIENAGDNSLILIEEIENGLHPVATNRMVEYLIDVASRKSAQIIFTTHSDYALYPLPNEAIWACINGSMRQGKLSVETLRAVSGRIDKKIAIFVEDAFSKKWVDSILREKLNSQFEEIEVHSVAGDGNALKTHLSHRQNPAIKSKSICIIDGDSSQIEDIENGVMRLPGRQPELSVFQDVKKLLPGDIAILTVSCQRSPESQESVQRVIDEIEKTNRDPHLIFNQIGIKIGFVAEAIVMGAFLSLWIRSNQEYCDSLAEKIRTVLNEV